jgi:hypothetical protein
MPNASTTTKRSERFISRTLDGVSFDRCDGYVVCLGEGEGYEGAANILVHELDKAHVFQSFDVALLAAKMWETNFREVIPVYWTFGGYRFL